MLVKRDIIRSTVLVQNPKNWIGIIGIDVGTQKPDLDDVRKRYPEFTFVVREKKELVIHKPTELVSKKKQRITIIKGSPLPLLPPPLLLLS